MLRPKPQLNLENAREYFREHLRVGDYYSEGQQVVGQWSGVAAEKLGLTGAVAEKDFLALCEGRNPQTNCRLTQRLNTVRSEAGKLTANRRIFHDFTISPPKSVSVVALCQDKRIVDLHDQAVRRAMTALEKYAGTRVRKSQKQGSRITGNMLAACFRHETSRELDPHLHTHCVVFNATFDPVEGRWKALQTEGMYRAQKFAENLYFHELSKSLRSLGYEIENNVRNFEIKGAPQSVIERFSKRHQQIESEARRQVADGYDGDLAELRRHIAHALRRRKQKNSTADALRPYWKEQLAIEERRALENLRRSGPVERQTPDVRAMVAWADGHLFARKAVVNDYELKSAALARGRGEDFEVEDLDGAISERGYCRRVNGTGLTTRELSRCYHEIIQAVRQGGATRMAIRRDYAPDGDLSPEQARAAKQILGSTDFLTLFRSRAGTGKSRTLKEVERVASSAGHSVLVLAPQRQQVQSLEDDGLRAQTLAHVLTTREISPRVIVILDEAGQVGVREMHDLISLVKQQQGRLILSGDTR